MNTDRRSRLGVATSLFAAAALWLAVAWLGRQEAPWAIRLTSPACAVALCGTYIAFWAFVIARSREPRRAMFRALAITASALVGVLVLEAPAVAGIIDYSRIRGVLTGEWDGPADDFVEDHALSFKRPPHARWSGWPRSNMAQSFNLPLRSTYRQTFSTDSRGFRNSTDVDRADVVPSGFVCREARISTNETAAVRLHELTGQQPSPPRRLRSGSRNCESLRELTHCR
jgi:hypothetical protein